MSLTLSWIDHDQQARERMERILALFEERDTRDELGLGAIRDSFSDLLFPGTSTIQTRLRYFLIVPWVYCSLEKQRVSSSDVSRRARELELDIGECLLANGENEGVFGVKAGRRLKRLPSSVYWAGLGAWGLRQFDGAQSRYHRALDAIYRRRHLSEKTGKGSELAVGPAITWHPGLPDPPRQFPHDVTFALTKYEAEYFRDRVAFAARKSLLARLFAQARLVDCRFPWEHPDYAGFDEAHKKALDHARLFSDVMHGAALLYNLLLARRAERDALNEDYRARLQQWWSGLDLGAVSHWSLDDLWSTIEGQGHRISPAAQRFVTRWVDLAKTGELGSAAAGVPVEGSAPARLVEERERRLKGPRSRFANQRSLDQWTGASGIDRMTFRWAGVRSFLGDLAAGLEAT